MKRILLGVLILSLLIFTAGCFNKTDEMEKFLKAKTGSWSRNGNLDDFSLIINDDGTWEYYGDRDEDGDIMLTGKGTISYDKEDKCFGFEDEMSNKIYICYPKTQDVIEFNNYRYIREEYSKNGFDDYLGKWYVDGDTDNDYFLFEEAENGSVMWSFFESDGIGHVSVDSGNLVWNGLNDVFIAEDYPDDFAVLTLMDSGELSCNGEDFILVIED